MGIEEVLSAPRSPWQSPYVERLIGSIRRECLDNVMVLHERQAALDPHCVLCALPPLALSQSARYGLSGAATGPITRAGSCRRGRRSWWPLPALRTPGGVRSRPQDGRDVSASRVPMHREEVFPRSPCLRQDHCGRPSRSTVVPRFADLVRRSLRKGIGVIFRDPQVIAAALRPGYERGPAFESGKLPIPLPFGGAQARSAGSHPRPPRPCGALPVLLGSVPDQRCWAAALAGSASRGLCRRCPHLRGLRGFGGSLVPTLNGRLNYVARRVTGVF